MKKFQVTVSYYIATTEIYEVYVEDDDLEEFHDSPHDYCDMTNKVEEFTGDIRNGSWTEHVAEINALDQIVQALDDSEQ